MAVSGERLEIQNGSLSVGPLDGGPSASLEATAKVQGMPEPTPQESVPSSEGGGWKILRLLRRLLGLGS